MLRHCLWEWCVGQGWAQGVVSGAGTLRCAAIVPANVACLCRCCAHRSCHHCDCRVSTSLHGAAIRYFFTPIWYTMPRMSCVANRDRRRYRRQAVSHTIVLLVCAHTPAGDDDTSTAYYDDDGDDDRVTSSRRDSSIDGGTHAGDAEGTPYTPRSATSTPAMSSASRGSGSGIAALSLPAATAMTPTASSSTAAASAGVPSRPSSRRLTASGSSRSLTGGGGGGGSGGAVVVTPPLARGASGRGSGKRDALKIATNSDGDVVAAGLTVFDVASLQPLLALLETAKARRSSGHHKLNMNSSRSHLVSGRHGTGMRAWVCGGCVKSRGRVVLADAMLSSLTHCCTDWRTSLHLYLSPSLTHSFTRLLTHSQNQSLTAD